LTQSEGLKRLSGGHSGGLHHSLLVARLCQEKHKEHNHQEDLKKENLVLEKILKYSSRFDRS
jgi:hypothetical protein